MLIKFRLAQRLFGALVARVKHYVLVINLWEGILGLLTLEMLGLSMLINSHSRKSQLLKERASY